MTSRNSSCCSAQPDAHRDEQTSRQTRQHRRTARPLPKQPLCPPENGTEGPADGSYFPSLIQRSGSNNLPVPAFQYPTLRFVFNLCASREAVVAMASALVAEPHVGWVSSS